MLSRNHPDGIHIAFDDHRLVNNAGLLLPATLGLHLGLPQLVDRHLDLGRAPGRANTGDKMMTLVASALAGGDCIDDADVLRTGGTACTLGSVVKAPSTLGTFLRSFRWGHVRQLDRVSRELLARAWKAGAGPGDAPFTIDLDSTICETYGLAKEGARHHGYTGKRGYHPLLDGAAGLGRADSDHQDPPAAVLRSGRTAHPLGTPVDSASSPALALGGAVQPRPRPAASHPIPSLTAHVRNRPNASKLASARYASASCCARSHYHAIPSRHRPLSRPGAAAENPLPCHIGPNGAQAFSLVGSLIPISPAFTPPIGGFGFSTTVAHGIPMDQIALILAMLDSCLLPPFPRGSG